jgi:hypothetical protein
MSIEKKVFNFYKNNKWLKISDETINEAVEALKQALPGSTWIVQSQPSERCGIDQEGEGQWSEGKLLFKGKLNNLELYLDFLNNSVQVVVSHGFICTNTFDDLVDRLKHNLT